MAKLTLPRKRKADGIGAAADALTDELQRAEDVLRKLNLTLACPRCLRSGLGTGAPTTEGTRYTSDQVVLHLGVSVWF